MKKYLIFFLVVLNSFVAFSQQNATVVGLVKSTQQQEILPYCAVYIKELNKSTQTDESGKYSFNNVPYGEYTISFYLLGYNRFERKINVNKANIQVDVVLEIKSEQLKSFQLEAKDESVGEVQRMKSIQGVLISQGKKNEVIQLAEINANKATNQGRQIYSRIPGLNIWESDGAGIQLGIGGRGLNPSRTSNFNTRQNGYDISADALGYPESYYTPPTEAVKQIQLIRGAASLQFGTQFGGLLNFVLHDGPTESGKEFEVIARQTLGSFDLNNTFLSVGFNKSTWKGYNYFQHKKGNEWRPNSNFQVYTAGVNVGKYLSEKTFVNIEFTKMYYLARQSGGLTDKEFYLTPEISKRSRNWFEVDWNLAAFNISHEFNSTTRIKTQFFGLHASRKALGVLGNISRPDVTSENRDLIVGEFNNVGNETRFLKIYEVGNNPWAFLVGTRVYKGHNRSRQGEADSTDLPHFTYLDKQTRGSDYEFPSTNFAFFTENIFRFGKFSVTPGMRYESISTNADGKFKDVVYDLAGNIVFDTTLFESRYSNRSFVIGGIGFNFKLNDTLDVYANFSQNYKSINFSDMQIVNKNFRIDPDLQDETGYNIDLGVRGIITDKINYDISGFLLLYDNRIGDIDGIDEQTFIPYRYRTNVSKAMIKGVEAMVEADWFKILFSDSSKVSFRTFVNFAVTDARYVESQRSAFRNKLVEFVPPYNIKTGATLSYKKFSITYQYTYVEEQFSDATNAGIDSKNRLVFVPNAIIGLIPAYQVMDLSMKYDFGQLRFETGVNNLTNEVYFTRRAVAYPGPGIIPSPIRNFYFTVQFKI
ncbi:MAG: carboxypeptidase-like regulatory domain-containing protein [Flavobacteriales bacterium]|nr:carboxypeptidase-like regulatory domain-containing protein [Flavobacteriales bacterium]